MVGFVRVNGNRKETLQTDNTLGCSFRKATIREPLFARMKPFDVPEGFRCYRRNYRRKPDTVIKEGSERITGAFYAGVGELSRLEPHVVAKDRWSTTAVASNHVTISETKKSWARVYVGPYSVGERRLGARHAEAI